VGSVVGAKPRKKGITGHQIVTQTATITDGVGTATADCPAGKAVLGGGFTTRQAGSIGNAVLNSYPSRRSAWTATVSGVSEEPFTVYAVCANARLRPKP
jgi:hypothetical protein